MKETNVHNPCRSDINYYKIQKVDWFGKPRYCAIRGIDHVKNLDGSWMWFDTVEKAREALTSIRTFEFVEEGNIQDLYDKKKD